MCVMELTGSWSASGGLSNAYAEPVFKAHRVGAHSTERITRARFVKDSSNVTYLQIYIASGHSSYWGKSVLEYTMGTYAQNIADSGSAAMFEAGGSVTGIRTLEVDDNAICVSAGSHKFYSGGNATERLTITSDGNISLTGTINGATQLNLQSTGGDIINVTSTVATSRSTIKFNTNGNDWEIGARGSSADNPNNFYIYDNNASTYRMLINSDGNIIKPDHCAFKSSQSGNYGGVGSLTTTVANVGILQAGEVYDRGSNYDTSTYLFTCPVDGIYLVNVIVSLGAVGSGRHIFVIAYTNGGGSTPLSNYYECIDGNTSNYANYSYCEPWYFTSGTTIGVGKNGHSGYNNNYQMSWGVHLLG